MDRYRILFFTSSLAIGGAERHVLNLCRYLRSAGHDASVCTISPVEDGLESAFVEEGIPLFRVPIRSLAMLPSPPVVSGLRRTVGAVCPHVLHAHLFQAEVAGAFASLLARSPLIVTRHSAGLEFHGWRRWAARFLEPLVRLCVAVSEQAADEAIALGYPRSKVSVVPNAVDPRRFSPLEEPDRERRRRALAASLFADPGEEPFFLVGSAGGLKAVKNFAAMVRLSARLSAIEREGNLRGAMRFVVFGSGPERGALAALTRELGVDSSFAFPGSREDLEEVLPLLDVFVLPSLSEGVPMALLEAMSSGVACVASEVGGIGKVLSGVGVLVPPGDEGALIDAVHGLLEHEASRRDLGRRARVRVFERYHIDIWGERMVSVYRSAIEGVSPGRPSR
jgi:glycosyltransferase involved in cell wall biosynthesis